MRNAVRKWLTRLTDIFARNVSIFLPVLRAVNFKRQSSSWMRKTTRFDLINVPAGLWSSSRNGSMLTEIVRRYCISSFEYFCKGEPVQKNLKSLQIRNLHKFSICLHFNNYRIKLFLFVVVVVFFCKRAQFHKIFICNINDALITYLWRKNIYDKFIHVC